MLLYADCQFYFTPLYVIPAYGPLFAGGPTLEHGPYVIHTVCHPCLQTVGRYVEVQIANTSTFMPGY